ncbi:MAG: hypothetical protein SW833_21495 [Cyanobacteriota bacterium]|nr:hypothetical protein [Cyanobacteriota bacterium]
MASQQSLNSNTHLSSAVSSNERQVVHLSAQEFRFKSSVEFPSSVRTNSDKYTELITHDNNGAFDIIQLDEGNATKYFFSVSSTPNRQCESDETRACQQGAAAPARGNIAEIQIVLPSGKLEPGTYRFAEETSAPVEEVTIYSRQLYSDPSHGQLGCQVWGEGAFNVERVVYNGEGQLEELDASSFRACDRTTPFPPIRPEDNLPQIEVEDIEKYVYRASWRCRLKWASPSPP